MLTRRFIVPPLFVIALLAFVQPLAAWGPEGHTLITRHAILMLPGEIKPFYEANERYIVAFAMLPDDWRLTYRDTGPEHYCDLDMLDEPPFSKLRASREEVEKRFGKDKVLEMGLLPWVIEERFSKLVAALKSGDHLRAVVHSALLAHYVGDAHVPFHATKHWDGNKPEQKGLHFRWETTLLALHLKPESVKPVTPVRIDDILSASFDWLAASHSHVDAICSAEDKAREQDPGHGYRYNKTMADETIGIVTARLTASAEALAGVYIAAWERAGKPQLSDKPVPLFWGE
jgi:hypothetical protein